MFRRAFFRLQKRVSRDWIILETVLTNPAFQLAVKNTGLFMLVCIPLLLSLSLVIAVWIYRHSKMGNFLKTGFLLPMAIPVAAVVLLWRILFDDRGLLNGVCWTAGGRGPVVDGYEDMGFRHSGGQLYLENLSYHIVLWLADCP